MHRWTFSRACSQVLSLSFKVLFRRRFGRELGKVKRMWRLASCTPTLVKRQNGHGLKRHGAAKRTPKALEEIDTTPHTAPIRVALTAIEHHTPRLLVRFWYARALRLSTQRLNWVYRRLYTQFRKDDISLSGSEAIDCICCDVTYMRILPWTLLYI